jgi:hypothetical protein
MQIPFSLYPLRRTVSAYSGKDQISSFYQYEMRKRVGLAIGWFIALKWLINAEGTMTKVSLKCFCIFIF